MRIARLAAGSTHAHTETNRRRSVTDHRRAEEQSNRRANCALCCHAVLLQCVSDNGWFMHCRNRLNLEGTSLKLNW